MARRGNQEEYNKLLDAFNATTKTKRDSVNHLIKFGFSRDQADNAVHVYWKGGGTKATFILSRDERDNLLDNFNAITKAPKECVNYLMIHYGCTYRQANGAVYKYREEHGLIGK